jgi:hypothetical protein
VRAAGAGTASFTNAVEKLVCAPVVVDAPRAMEHQGAQSVKLGVKVWNNENIEPRADHAIPRDPLSGPRLARARAGSAAI